MTRTHIKCWLCAMLMVIPTVALIPSDGNFWLGAALAFVIGCGCSNIAWDIAEMIEAHRERSPRQ